MTGTTNSNLSIYHHLFSVAAQCCNIISSSWLITIHIIGIIRHITVRFCSCHNIQRR